jgi:hypothetical protein
MISRRHHNAASLPELRIDFATGFGSFCDSTFSSPMLFPGDDLGCIWPYISVDRNNRIHLVAAEPNAPPVILESFGYKRSTDGGVTWTANALVDTITDIGE